MDHRGQLTIEHFATEENPFHFTDCGLDNVYLVGIRYFEKANGSFSAEIPALKQLLNLIARDLVFSDSELQGCELRFLRQRLGIKSVDFARILSLDISTLSRIEREKQNTSAQVSKLAKFAYAVICADPELAELQRQLRQLISEELRQPHDERIVMRISADNEWSELKVAA